MSTISTIVTNLKSEVSTALGSNYSEMKHAIDIEKNSRRLASKRYGVLPKSLTQIAGVTKYYTVDHGFEITLVDDFIGSGTGDSDKQSITIALYDKCLSIYQGLVTEKAGTPASVMNVKDLSIADPEYNEDVNIVIMRMSITLTYRISI